MDRIRQFFGAEPEPEVEQGFLEELGEELTMTKTQRMYAFLICIGLGFLCIFLAIAYLPMAATNPAKFAFIYTLGNLLSIGSTLFLVGPVKQIKNMLDPSRAFSTLIYFLSMFMTLVATYKMKSSFIVVICVVFQFAALIWYCLSYIPFAQTVVQTCCTTLSRLI